MYLRKLFLLCPLALLLAAPAAAQNEVEVIASDFSFVAPEELPAGPLIRSGVMGRRRAARPG